MHIYRKTEETSFSDDITRKGALENEENGTVREVELDPEKY